MAQRSFFDRVVLADTESAVIAAAASNPTYPPAATLVIKDDATAQIGTDGASIPITSFTPGASASVNRQRNPADEQPDKTRFTLDANDVLRGTYYSSDAPASSATRGWARGLSDETVAMFEAAQQCNSFQLKKSLATGRANRSAKNNDADGETILHTVVRHRDDNLSCLLSVLSEDELPRLLPNSRGESPLHVAAQQSHHIMLLPLLLRSYPSGFSRPDDRGDTYLHTLMRNKQLTTQEAYRILTIVLKEHPEVVPQQTLNVRNKDGLTVLDVAVSHHAGDPAAAELQTFMMRFGATTGVAMIAGELVRVRSVEDQHRQKVARREAAFFASKIDAAARQERADIQLRIRVMRVSSKLRSKEMVARAILVDTWLRGHSFLQTARSLEHAELVRMQHRIRQDNMAIRLQCWWRGLKASWLAAALRARRAELTAAAIKTQRVFRRYRLARLVRATKAAERLHAVRTCQTMWRLRQLEKRIYMRELERKKNLGWWVEDAYKSLVFSAIRCQSGVRGYLARCAARRRTLGVVLSQSHLRYLLSMLEVQRRYERRVSTNVLISYLRTRRAREMRIQLCIKERSSRGRALITTSVWRDHLVNSLYERVRRKATISQHPLDRFLVHEGLVEGSDASLLWTLKGAPRSLPNEPPEEMYLPNTRYIPVSQNYRDAAAITQQITALEVFDDAETSFLVRPKPAVKKWSRTIGEVYTEYLGWASFTPFENMFEKHKGMLQLLDASGYLLAALMLSSMIASPRTNAESILKDIDGFVVALLWVRVILLPKTVGLTFDVLTLLASTISLATSFEDGNVFYTFLLLKVPLFVGAHYPTYFYAVCTYNAAFVSTLYGWFLLLPVCLGVIGVVLRSSIVPGEAQEGGGIAQQALFLLSTNSVGGATTGSSAFTLPSLTIGSYMFMWWSYASCAFGVLFALKKVLEEEVWVYDEDSAPHSKNRASLQSTQASGDDRVFVGDSPSALNHNASWLREIVAGKTALRLSREGRQVPANLPQLLDARRYWTLNPATALTPHIKEHMKASAVSLWYAADTADHIDPFTEATHPCVLKDTAVIESVLLSSKALRPSTRVVSVMLRQWEGAVHKREAHVFINVCLVLCGVSPNQWPLEMFISGVFIVELTLSLAVLPSFVTNRNYRIPLLLRLYCCVCGFLPWTLPFVALRGLRLLEGWGALLIFSRTHKYMVAVGVAHTVLFWIVGYTSLLQGSYDVMRVGGWCASKADCLQRWTEILFIPTINTHVEYSITNTPASAIILFFRFVFVPLFVMITLHPLLRLTVVAIRLLRQITRSMHDDLLLRASAFLEGSEWYRARSFTLHNCLTDHVVYGGRTLFQRLRRASKRRRPSKWTPWVDTPILLMPAPLSADTSRVEGSFSRTNSPQQSPRDLSPMAPTREASPNAGGVSSVRGELVVDGEATFEARRVESALDGLLSSPSVMGTFVSLRVSSTIIRKLLWRLHFVRERIRVRRKWDSLRVYGGAPPLADSGSLVGVPIAFESWEEKGPLSYAPYPVSKCFAQLLSNTSTEEAAAPAATIDDIFAKVTGDRVGRIGLSTFSRVYINNQFVDVLLSAAWFFLRTRITMNIFYTPKADRAERERLAEVAVVDTARHRATSARPDMAPTSPVAHEIPPLMSPRSLPPAAVSEIDGLRNKEIDERIAARDGAVAKYLRITSLLEMRHGLPLHVANFVLLLLSISFIWLESNLEGTEANDVVSICSMVVLMLSTAVALIVIPLDASGVFTIVSCGASITALIFQTTPSLKQNAEGNYLYSMRFTVHLRLMQVLFSRLAVYQYFASILTRASLRYLWFIVFFVAVIYVSELLRAQVSILQMPYTTNEALAASSNGTLAYRQNDAIWGSSVSTLYPYGMAVRERLMDNLLDNIDLYYLFFQYWLIPTVSLACIAAYLRFFSLNLRTTPSLITESVRRLPDPLSVSRMPRIFSVLFPAGCFLLVGSLAFVSVSEPAAVNFVNVIYVNQTTDTIVNLDLLERLDNTFYIVECSVLPLLIIDSLARLWYEGLMLLSRCYAVRGSNRRRVRRAFSVLFQLMCSLLLVVSFILSLVCIMSPTQNASLSHMYITTLVPLRFLLLIRHQHFSLWDLLMEHAGWIAFILSCSVLFVVFGGGSLAASSQLQQFGGPLTVPPPLYDTYANATSLSFGELFDASTSSVVRCMLMTGLPSIVNQSTPWIPHCDADFATPSVFVVGVIGRILLACFVGFFTALISVHLEPLLSDLPPHARRIYGFLSRGPQEYHAGLLNTRGPDGIVLMGSGDSHRVVGEQVAKFNKGIFHHYQHRRIQSVFRTPNMWTAETKGNTNGCIPSYMLPHLLEEMQTINPCLQRGTMWLLRYFIQVAPLLHERRRRVNASLQWAATCNAGGPLHTDAGKVPSLLFSFVDHSVTLRQEFPMEMQAVAATAVPRLNLGRRHVHVQPPNRHGLTYTYPDYISSLHLVEALSILELGFPSSTSGDCVMYEDMLNFQFRERAATMLQSTWKMFCTVRHFERVNPYRTVVAFRQFRRTSREWMCKKVVEAKVAGSFEAALARFKHVYNPRGRHYELLSSLNRTYQPTQLREDAAAAAELEASTGPMRHSSNVLLAGPQRLDVGLLTHNEWDKWRLYLQTRDAERM